MLSMTASELLEELKTTVYFLVVAAAIKKRSGTVVASEIENGDKTSFIASTMLMTGRPPPPLIGSRGLDTNARNLSPLVVGWGLVGFEFPQEMSANEKPTSTARVMKPRFKPWDSEENEGYRFGCKKADYNRAKRRLRRERPRGDAKGEFILYSR